MKRDITFELPDRSVTFKDVELPDANTPLPPTNATIHVLAREDGYGTPERTFHVLCGVSWPARGSTGEHMYFHAEETHWHKHVNCLACLKILQGADAPAVH